MKRCAWDVRELRYTDFAHRIDIDAFEEAIGFAGEDDGKGNDVGHCPDPWNLHKHGDSTGKFAIHREKRVFNCWVCDGGSLLSLAMATEDLSEQDAIIWLYQFAGEQTDERFEQEIDDLLHDEMRRDPILPYFNTRVLDKYDQGLKPDDPIWDWLLERGIDDQVAAEHRVGYDPDAVKLSKRNGRYEGPGIIFPHFWRGQLVGWQTRFLEPDDTRPKWVQKYNNTLDMPKRWTIYDYERWYIMQRPIIVVESVPSALYVQSIGYPSMAVFGSNVTPEQLKLLRACQQGVILAPDNDEPGMKFVRLCMGYLEPFIPVRVCEPVGVEGSGADLADIDKSNAVEVIENAEDLSLY